MITRPETLTSQASRLVASPNGISDKRTSTSSVERNRASAPPMAIRAVDAKNAVPFWRLAWRFESMMRLSTKAMVCIQWWRCSSIATLRLRRRTAVAIHHELVAKPSKAEDDQRQPVEKRETGQAVTAYKRDRASQERSEYILGDGLLVSEAVAQGCRRWKRPHLGHPGLN